MGFVRAEITYDGGLGKPPSLMTIPVGVMCTIHSFLRDFLKGEQAIFTASLVPLEDDDATLRLADFGQLVDAHLNKRFKLRIGDRDTQVLIRFF